MCHSKLLRLFIIIESSLSLKVNIFSFRKWFTFLQIMSFCPPSLNYLQRTLKLLFNPSSGTQGSTKKACWCCKEISMEVWYSKGCCWQSSDLEKINKGGMDVSEELEHSKWTKFFSLNETIFPIQLKQFWDTAEIKEESRKWWNANFFSIWKV